jgi:hypothetical protein
MLYYGEMSTRPISGGLFPVRNLQCNSPSTWQHAINTTLARSQASFVFWEEVGERTNARTMARAQLAKATRQTF